jgi:GDPmannose 4,6-dehydratase
MSTALVTGSRGQDGTYLAAYLGRLGYHTVGIDRDGPVDLRDREAVRTLLGEVQPREIYHLAAHHHASQGSVGDDLDLYRRSHDIHALATANLLDGISRTCPTARLFFAGSCQLFGAPSVAVQDESTPMRPDNVYAITKLAGVNLCHYYRRQRGVYAAVGLLFNHESPLRGPNFVSKKIAAGAVAIRQGRQSALVLGDLDAEIDWGFAGDYVAAMHGMLQLPEPEDFVVASGERHSIRDFVEHAFTLVGLDWQRYVTVAPGLLRAQPRTTLHGNPAKLTRMTGWKPTMSFSDLIRLMVNAELEKHDHG